jgi:hypothetical protein
MSEAVQNSLQPKSSSLKFEGLKVEGFQINPQNFD